MDLEFDRKHLWHPYTCATSPDNSYPVVSAKGSVITLSPDIKLVDGMASWWSAIHGYSHPILVKAVQKQAANLSHIMFGGLTHEPAIELGKKLLEILPKSFQHIFYADSGSVAVEVAMKTALQFQRNNANLKRNKFLTIKRGYHGDTVGAMSVCDPISGMHALFSGYVLPQIFVSAPPLGFDTEITDEDFAEISGIAEAKQDEIAAVILEPIVQGAGGMRIYSPQYLKKIRDLCDKFDFVLIFDEIATGFGRTGKMFAFEHANILPDIICVGKALTGGMLTLSAMITSAKIAEIACKNGLPLMHGPTFMANPLACAAAKANLDLLTSWNWKDKILSIEKTLKDKLSPLKNNPKVADVRVIGAIGVVEMKEKINVAQFQVDCISRGAWIRPFGKIAYIMPPYIISQKELEKLVAALIFAVR
ncbi:MAG: adenosylmethionine--8-amino-7-oxononanoate transaminase [Chitinivibrionia bacterium]|nr:adenosylmethionine--8-amino-7-oxononanoate transaminase [Chitinivibrionia bacterium]